jgi:uncharacterized protein
MILNLRELALKDAPVELHGSLNMSELVSGRRDLRLADPVKADLTAEWDSGLATIEGTLSAKLELDCSKCLKTFSDDVEYPVLEMFTQQRSVAEKDEDIHLVNEDRIDLASYLESAFLVQLPFASVCSSDCKGLCPVCGTDLNTHSCDCVQEKIDPRLAGLKDLFKQQP